MSERPTKLVHNFDTGLTEIIELTDGEIAEREELAAQYEAERLAREEEEQAKAAALTSFHAKLEALGITPEEIAAWRG
jgi:hypothetical protein